MTSKMYTSDGKIIDFDELYELKSGEKISFFRKQNPAQVERYISSILFTNPHPNIVTIYDFNETKIDMELVNTNIINKIINNKSKFIGDITNAKNHMISLGISYIDWKIDNIGYSEKDKCFKVFDFDGGGIFSKETNKWIVKPAEYFVYREARKNYISTPEGIDNFGFYSKNSDFFN